jgi:ERCC4-type nuclease
MTLSLHIDHRERALHDDLSTTLSHVGAPSILMRPLDSGDCALFVDETMHTLFERKTFHDVAASLYDGRWSEQKHRMLSHAPSVIYIFETQGLALFDEEYVFHGGIRIRSVCSAILNLWIHYHIPCFITRSVSETATFLARFCEQVQKGHETPHTPRSYDHALVKSCMSQKRKGNHTPETFFLHCLHGVPGISTTLATNIAALFDNSFQRMCTYLLNHTDVDLQTLYKEHYPKKRLALSTCTQLITLFCQTPP